MGITEKIASASKSKWVAEGIFKAELKTIVELAKISARIERSRLDMNMTQKEFADYMGVSQGMISKWESREYNFTIKSLNEICEKLNLTASISMEQSCSRKEYTVIKWNKEKLIHKNEKPNWGRHMKDKGAIA